MHLVSAAARPAAATSGEEQYKCARVGSWSDTTPSPGRRECDQTEEAKRAGGLGKSRAATEAVPVRIVAIAQVPVQSSNAGAEGQPRSLCRTIASPPPMRMVRRL